MDTIHVKMVMLSMVTDVRQLAWSHTDGSVVKEIWTHGTLVRRFVEMDMIFILMNVMMEIWFLEMDVLSYVQLKEGIIAIKLEQQVYLEVRKLTQPSLKELIF